MYSDIVAFPDFGDLSGTMGRLADYSTTEDQSNG